MWVIKSFPIKGRQPLTEKLSESIKSCKFLSHRARMSGEFDSRNYSHSTKFEQRSQIFVKLDFRELCDSKLSDLHAFDNMAMIHWVKIGQKQKGRVWVLETPILEIIFYDSHWELNYCNKWHPGNLKISTQPGIAVGTHFHAGRGTKNTPDGEASCLLLSNSISLLSGSTVPPESTCSCILRVTGQICESQKRVSISTSQSYHQRLSP